MLAEGTGYRLGALEESRLLKYIRTQSSLANLTEKGGNIKQIATERFLLPCISIRSILKVVSEILRPTTPIPCSLLGNVNHFFQTSFQHAKEICSLSYIFTTRSTQRAQTSLARADYHYSLLPIVSYTWRDVKLPSGNNVTMQCIDLSKASGSFTHFRRPRSPPKCNHFFIAPPKTPPHNFITIHS